METIEILKKVLEQEIAAEKRYASQINNIRKAFVIRKIISDIRAEEIQHAKKAIEKIKQINPDFNFILSESEIETRFEGKDSLKQIKEFLELDIKRERQAYKSYLNFSNQVSEQEIKVMLIHFIEDEKQHEQKIQNLIDNLKRLE